MSIKQISVFLENKPGTLNTMTDVLARHQVDMQAFTLAETSDFGIARIIVDDVYKTSVVLKEAGFVNSVSDVLCVAIPDEPGGLNKVLQVLAQAQVNVEYIYVFQGRKSAGTAWMIFKVADLVAATAALSAKDIRTITQEELGKL